MSAQPRKPDEGTKTGVDRSLKTAFAPDSPVDPELRRLIREADGVYLPDEVSDQRVGQLLTRLRELPWGEARGAFNGQ